MKSLFAVPALLMAVNTWAACPAVMPSDPPQVPDGRTASFEQMADAQVSVEDYVNQVEAFLECRSQIHPLIHNRAVFLAETTAGAYNEALASFRKRDSMLANN